MMIRKRNVTKREKINILEIQDYSCDDCYRAIDLRKHREDGVSYGRAEFHHQHMYAYGGSSDADTGNIIALCHNCHLGKTRQTSTNWDNHPLDWGNDDSYF